jgi:hypothetical protein
MYVNKLAFLVTISWHMKFSIIELLPNWREDTIGTSLSNVMHRYGSHGFLVTMTHADGEIEPIRNSLAAKSGSGLNVCSNDKHVPEIERFIWMVKERSRCLYNSVPFRRFPVLMCKEMVTSSRFWLNMFPSRDGVSDTLSTRALMNGYTLDYTKHCRLEFGLYIQTHEEHDNLMESHTTGAIALHHTGNHQGGYYFMSLSTGRKLTRNCWTALPLPQDVINCVDTLSRRCHAAADLTFAWRDGTPILDLEDGFDDDLSAADSDYRPSDTDSSDNFSADGSSDNGSQSGASVAGVDNDDNDIDDNDNDDNDNDDDNHDDFQEEDNEHEAPNKEEPDNNEAHANKEAGDIAADTMVEAPGFEAVEAPMISNDEDGTEMNDDSIETPGVDDKVETIKDLLKNTGVGTNENPPENPGVGEEQGIDTVIFDEGYDSRNGKYDLRARKPREYSHLHPDLENTAFTQYNVWQGLKIFGEAGAQAVVKEMKQLHYRAVIQPKLAAMLTREEKKCSLQYLMFLKQK